jgi:hypothetical protein
MPRWHSSYKDPYYYPKNMFQKKPREYYAARTTYKLPEHLKPILEEYLKKPQPKFNKDNYCVCCYKYRSPEQTNLSNFIISIAPYRRMEEGRTCIWLVKRPKGFTKTLPLNPSTKDKVLPLIFEAIEKGCL